jgi:hypothetical protein
MIRAFLGDAGNRDQGAGIRTAKNLTPICTDDTDLEEIRQRFSAANRDRRIGSF